MNDIKWAMQEVVQVYSVRRPSWKVATLRIYSRDGILISDESSPREYSICGVFGRPLAFTFTTEDLIASDWVRDDPKLVEEEMCHIEQEIQKTKNRIVELEIAIEQQKAYLHCTQERYHNRYRGAI